MNTKANVCFDLTCIFETMIVNFSSKYISVFHQFAFTRRVFFQTFNGKWIIETGTKERQSNGQKQISFHVSV